MSKNASSVSISRSLANAGALGRTPAFVARRSARPLQLQNQRRITAAALLGALDERDRHRFLSYLRDDCTFRFGSQAAQQGHPAIAHLLSGLFECIDGLRHRIHKEWRHECDIVAMGEAEYLLKNADTATVPFCVVLRCDDEERLVSYQVFCEPPALWT